MLPPGFGAIAEHLRRSTVLVTGSTGGAGSGIILRSDGTIATNAHVVHTSDTRVQLWDGRTFRATLIERDTRRDIALLSVSATGLTPVTTGDTGAVRTGQLVLAVGNPFGFIGAVSAGIVHAVGPVPGLGHRRYIQSDLHLAPGNSGGPLADASGRVIGMNTMVAGRLGLSIPCDELQRAVSCTDSRSYLGIIVHQSDITVNGTGQQGLLIMEVLAGSAAASASLMPGDIIIGLEERPLTSIGDLENALAGPGDHPIHVQFLRGDRRRVRRAAVVPQRRRNKAA